MLVDETDRLMDRVLKSLLDRRSSSSCVAIGFLHFSLEMPQGWRDST
jgi:hypothetical protein